MKKAFISAIIFLVSANFAVFLSQTRPSIPVGNKKANQRPPQPEKTPPSESKTETTNEDGEILTDDDVIKIDTNLVTIPVKVLDRSGRFIGGLKKTDFKVFEDEVEQEITYFSNMEEPFTVALVLDMSPSATFKIQEIQNAAITFISQLRPRDKVMIVSFDAEYHILTEPTNDRKQLIQAIRSTKIASGTSLYETIDYVINDCLKKIDGRKAIVLFSDGVDTTSIKSHAGDNLRDIYELDVSIYPIEYNTFNDVQSMKNKPVIPQTSPIPGTKNPLPFPFPLPTIGTANPQGTSAEDYRRAHEYLDQLSNQTSGRLYQADTASNLALAFSNIADELRQTYSLGFYPEENKTQKRRKLKVRVNQKGYVIRARDSYVPTAINNQFSSK